jgi:hypothetical protein
VQETDVALLKTMFVAAAPPNVMLVGVARKPVPVIVTLLPPEGGPAGGLQLVTVGGGLNVKTFVPVPVCPSGLVTTTLTVPAA